jgi:hypothetical protein
VSLLPLGCRRSLPTFILSPKLHFHAASLRIVYLGNVRTLLLTAFFAAGFAGYLSAQRTPVVVELFTSEGCSSCPAADNLLSRLPRSFSDVDVIPLSEHVDYWNHLGWKDRFSAPLFSDRQQDYGRMFHLESVYTPQIVINGQIQCSGNDSQCVEQAIHKDGGPRATTQLMLISPVAMRVVVDHIPEHTRNADVFLAVTESGLDSLPNKGENNGVRLRHTGVVRNLTSLAHIDTKRSANYIVDAKLTPNSEWRQENLQYVLFVQDRATRRVIGATTLRPFATNGR